MCLAIPARVEELADEHQATVDILGVRRQVSIDLLRDESLQPGEWVLVHVGFAMSKISPERAEEQIRLLAALGEAGAAEQEAQGYGLTDEAT